MIRTFQVKNNNPFKKINSGQLRNPVLLSSFKLEEQSQRLSLNQVKIV